MRSKTEVTREIRALVQDRIAAGVIVRVDWFTAEILAMKSRIEGEDADGQISDDPDTLKMDLLEYCDRKVNGTPVLLPGAIKMIQEECAKPADQRDVKKMRDWHKRARAKVEGK